MSIRDWIKVALLTPVVLVGLLFLLFAFVFLMLLVITHPIVVFVAGAVWLSYIRIDEGRWPWQ